MCDDNFNCYTEGGYSDTYYQRIPDYKVYRIVNGTEELVEHISGSVYSRTNSFSISENNFWGDLVPGGYNLRPSAGLVCL